MGQSLHILKNNFINIQIRFRTHSAMTNSRLDFSSARLTAERRVESSQFQLKLKMPGRINILPKI